jgi:hypothetical protein
MSQWALPTIAVLLVGYGAVSGRLQSTVVTQAMVFVALGLRAGQAARPDIRSQHHLADSPIRSCLARHGW